MPQSQILRFDADDRSTSPIRGAVGDLAAGLERVELWGTMGWLDVRQRYSRSIMGPFWVTASLAIFVAGIGVTYGALFRMQLWDYLPYLAVGMVVWTMLSSFLIEGCRVFIDAQGAIKQMPAPLSIHVYRLTWRSLTIFGHNAIIIVAILMVTGPVAFLWGLVPSLVGVAITTLNGACFAITLGTFSARFRDIPPLMANIVQLVFFVTPILWRASDLGERAIIAQWNPIFHLIEIIRAPLLGGEIRLTSWIVALAFTAINLLVATLVYARFRWRIPYWL